VIIVGGGLAGLTAAYRLAQGGIPSIIYEGRERFGGRVCTLQGFNQEGMYCDLGGEFVDSEDANLLALAQELGVPIEDYGPFNQGLEDALFFSDGTVYTQEQLVIAFRPFAALIDQDRRSFTVGGVVQMPTCQNPMGAQALDLMSLQAYLDSKTDQVERWVLKMIGSAYRGEFGLELDQQSSLNLLALIGTEPFSLFGASDESKHIKGGSSTIPNALAAALQGKVPVAYGHVLKAIADDGSATTLTFASPSGTRDVRAAQVIMAIPFSTLRYVDGIDRIGLSPVKLKSIRDMGYGPLAKFMLGFTGRVWRSPTGPAPASTGSVYTDLRSRQFWDTSRTQPGTSGLLTDFLSAAEGLHVAADQQRRSLVALERIWPGISDRFDGNTALGWWAREPLSQGAYACFTPGQYTGINGAAGTPELGGRLLFAGEHCSVDWQGFMEGAIETGNQAAQALLTRQS
jgi:monoamine oxidase